MPASPRGWPSIRSPMRAAASQWHARSWSVPRPRHSPPLPWPTKPSADPETTMLSNSLIELDRAHLVHPVASYRGHEQQGVRVLASGKGATVTDAQGHQLIDGFAGLWCVNAGYGHESIVEAAARQM